MKTLRTPITIVGAGPAGLTTALALASYGVEHRLIERHPGPAHTPRAHIVNQRTVEIMRHLGIEEQLTAASSSHESMRHSVWYTTLTQPEVARRECWGTEWTQYAQYKAASPCTPLNCPQTSFEPVLIDAVRARGSEVHFGHEFVTMERSGDGWLSTVRDRSDDTLYQIQSDFVVGADGAKAKVLNLVGLDVEGKSGLFHAANIWFRADLSRHFAHRPGVLMWNIHPDPAAPWGLGTFICMKPFTEFVLVRMYDPAREDLTAMSDRQAIDYIERAVGEPVGEVEILNIAGWQVNAQVAPSYGRDGAYSAGDAVHRHPPTNGLGLNMSVADGFNLAWKLALVHQGKAGAALLDTYSTERQPVGAAGVERAITSLYDAAAFRDAVGLTPDLTEEQGWRALQVLNEPTPEGDERRAALRAALDQTDYRFNALGLEVGYQYRTGALVDDAASEPCTDRDPVLHYERTTRPGARLPHARLERDRVPISSLDLVDGLQFSLLVGLYCQHWRDAARQVSDVLGVDIAVHEIGGGAILDPYFEWADSRQVGHDGAVLVRPDRHVAWRSVTGSNAAARLETAMRRILHR
ncbi:FAD-dependent monooxygenase [Mycolicibacterium sp. CBM1]